MKMKVFAHYYEDEAGIGYRWRTLLQFGTSWKIIGSVVMKNPGSAAPRVSEKDPTKFEQVEDTAMLEQLKRFSDESEYAWYYFNCDDTMQKVGSLFSEYYKDKISPLNGVIQVFNLMNVRDPDLDQALVKYQRSSFELSKTTESDIESLVAPVYIGWSNLWKKEPFQEDAKKIFNAVREQFDGKYLYPSLEDNKFYHPQYLMGRGRYSYGRPILNSFCQNTIVPELVEPQIMHRKRISKRDVFEKLVKDLREEFKLVAEKPKTCCFQFTEELVLIVTYTEQGYVGIRHSAYVGKCKYCRGNYPNIAEYRTILQKFGYNTDSEVWLGTKLFKEYCEEFGEDGIVDNIIEIRTLLSTTFSGQQ